MRWRRQICMSLKGNESKINEIIFRHGIFFLMYGQEKNTTFIKK